MDSGYVQKKIHAIAILLLIVGGFNWGILAFSGRDAVTSIFGKGSIIANGIFLLVGISALCLAFYRDSYLPFLGPSVMPCELLKEQIPENADFSVRIFVKPGTKVLYWAAEPVNKDLEHIQDWKHAYLGMRNAGVAVADKDGYVTLKVRKPQGYTVPMKGELSPHIHYRECSINGFIDTVKTVQLDGKEYFENMRVDKEDETRHMSGEKARDDNAHDFIVANAERTLSDSLMIQDGAIDEYGESHGSPF